MIDIIDILHKYIFCQPLPVLGELVPGSLLLVLVLTRAGNRYLDTLFLLVFFVTGAENRSLMQVETRQDKTRYCSLNSAGCRLHTLHTAHCTRPNCYFTLSWSWSCWSCSCPSPSGQSRQWKAQRGWGGGRRRMVSCKSLVEQKKGRRGKMFI